MSLKKFSDRIRQIAGGDSGGRVSGHLPITCTACAFTVRRTSYQFLLGNGRLVCPQCKSMFNHDPIESSSSSSSPPPPPPSDLQLSLSLSSFAPPLPSTCNNNTQHPTSRRVLQITRSEDIPHPPYPWAAPPESNSKTLIKSLDELRALNIDKIQGVVRCRVCNHKEVYEYDVEQEFVRIASTIPEIRMNDRAPKDWVLQNKYLLPCPACAVRPAAKCLLLPEIPYKMENINWLFLLLSKTLGNCNLAQLKYFCKRTGNLRTAAKDRLLLLTYTTLCEQFDSSFAPC